MNTIRARDVNGYYSDFVGSSSSAVTVTNVNCSE